MEELQPAKPRPNRGFEAIDVRLADTNAHFADTNVRASDTLALFPMTIPRTRLFLTASSTDALVH